MEIKVFLRNLRTAPRKSRQVADLIRNKNIAQARAVLEFTVNKSSTPILKLLNSAVASAVNDLKLEESNLKIVSVMVDEGPKLKRSHPMSRGRAYPIIKRTCHICLIVGEIKPSKEVNAKTPAGKKPASSVGREIKEAKVAEVKPEIKKPKAAKKVTKKAS